ncbi:MAG: flippase-like domain-containing protein [Chloroflexi bacterium]|nr:flippase-like domain-containing protein [Chloroflexota bacterium]
MKRHWLLWLLTAVFFWAVVTRLTEIEELIGTLSQGRWEWVLVAAVLQIAYYAAFAALYQAAFHVVGVDSRIGELFPVVLAAVFVTAVAPSGGASAAALLVNDAARRRQSTARAAAGFLLARVANFGTFILVLIVGLIHLFLHHTLQAYQIAGAAILTGLTIVQGGLLALGLWQPERLRQVLGWVQRGLNEASCQLGRPVLLPEGWAERVTVEFGGAADAIAAHPWRLTRLLAVGLVVQLVDLVCLCALFRAFRQPVGPGVLIAGYAVGILFWIVSITPQGIGAVEGVMALAYTSLRIPAEKAVAIALAFRGLTLWLPLAIGFLVLRRLGPFSPLERAHIKTAKRWGSLLLSTVLLLVALLIGHFER